MSYLITVDKKGKTILRPECILLCPELAYLTHNEVIAIVLGWDYYALFRQFADDERMRRARAHVFGSEQEDFWKQPKIKKAVELYRSLQFDHRRERIKVCQKTLSRLNDDLDTMGDADTKRIKDNIAAAKELRKEIRDIEEEIYKEEEVEVANLEGDMKLSLLERLQKNTDRYKEVTAKKELVKANAKK